METLTFETYDMAEGVYDGLVLESKIISVNNKRRWLLKIQVDNLIFVSLNPFPVRLNTPFGNAVYECSQQYEFETPEVLQGIKIQFKIQHNIWKEMIFSNIASITIYDEENQNNAE